MNEARLQQARKRAARYCSLRERAPSQVVEWLYKHGITYEEAEQVVSFLVEEHFLSEERFARAFVHDKLEFNQWGKTRLKVELQRHQIDPSIVQQVLDDVSETHYLAIAERLATRKWERLDTEPDDWIKKQKTAAYLASKGFESDLVWKCVNRLSAGLQ